MAMAESMLLATLVAFVLLLVGAGLLATAYLIRTYHVPHRVVGYRPALLGIALALFASGPCLFGVVATYMTVFEFPTDDDVAFLVAWGIVAVLLGGLSLLYFFVWSNGRDQRSNVEEQRLQRYIRVMQVFGWVIIALTAGTVGLAFVLPPILVGFAGVYVWGNHRRAQQANLLWMLAIATEKSIPLPAEVDAFAATTWGTRRSRLTLLADMLRNGTPLPSCLEAVPGLVPKSSLPAIHLGAEVGQISRALRDSAVRQTNDLQGAAAFRTISYTSFYIWALLAAITGIVGFLMYFIVPKLKAIFVGFDVELPTVTAELIRRADMAVEHFYLAIPALSLPFFMLIVECLGHIFGWDSLDVPLVGWLSRLETPQLLRGLSRVVAAGRPLPDALRVLSDHHHRRGIRAKAERIRYFVEQGCDTWDLLRQERFLLGAEALLLRRSEQLGNLPWVLNELADAIERRTKRRALCAAQLIQPAVVLLLGFVVGSICVGFLMPLIKVINELS
jgi:type II secretory pathway component PulF